MEKQLLDILLAHNINPDRLVAYLELTRKENREIFELIRPTLSKKEAIKRELDLLNGEIFSSVLRTALL